MWKDALAACRKDEADLASIHNIEEQSFIISQSGYCECVYSYFYSLLGGSMRFICPTNDPFSTEKAIFEQE